MYVLGVSCFFHDSAAVLIRDDVIVAAAQEERFTRIKHDAGFPVNSIRFCLAQAGIKLDQVDKVAFYEDPELKFRRIKKTYVDFFPRSVNFIIRSWFSWQFNKVNWRRNFQKLFLDNFNYKLPQGKLYNTEHHKSHAASAFFPSPYDEAAVLVLDGVGEFATTSLWKGSGASLEKIMDIQFPHSIGLLYSAITYYLGFKVNSGEYKVMGLAPYGRPTYVDLIKNHLISISDDGNYSLNMAYFDYAFTDKMTNQKFDKLFGGTRRLPESELTQREMDIARSLQEIIEEVMVKLAVTAKNITGSKNLCLAGGVALNCVGNGKIFEKGIFEGIWIQPAAGDAGGALGAALCCFYEKTGARAKHPHGSMDFMQGAYLGPASTDKEIIEYLDSVGAQYQKLEDKKLFEFVAQQLDDGKIIGWHRGRMEFGPRALGARSIIGDARNSKMQSIMNLKIKFRESFRPFAPIVLHDKVADYFEFDSNSPYMLFVAKVKKSLCKSMTTKQRALFGIEKLNIVRSEIPAVTHVDYSARLQTVHQETNPALYGLMKQFEKLTNCAVLVNTSFNVRGEPIVCTPEDGFRCFMRTGIDILVIENYVLLKESQPKYQDDENWRERFELD
ncbi:MAG: carbamoyltransferase [Paracoccaceae bacterium]